MQIYWKFGKHTTVTKTIFTLHDSLHNSGFFIKFDLDYMTKHLWTPDHHTNICC